MKRLFSLLMAAMIVLPSISAAAVSKVPQVYINGTKTQLLTEPYWDQGAWMIPLKETMEKAGLPITWNEETGAYEGQIGDILLSVTPDTNQVEYDLIPFELDHVCLGIDGDVMIEAAFLDTIYEANAAVSDDSIYISFTPPAAEETEFDIDAYLEGLPDQRVIIGEEQLFQAKLSNPSYLSQEVVEVKDNPNFDKALELKNFNKLILFYESQITMTISDYVNEGDMLVISGWVRSARSIDESGLGKFNCTFEALDANWTKFCNETREVNGEWQKFYLPFEMPKSLADKGAQLGLRIGYFEQDIQFAKVSVMDYGPDVDMSGVGNISAQSTYYGREEGALWREEALKRIEKYRVRDIHVNVRDEEGNPVPDAKVAADMTRSEFRWGTAVNYPYLFNQGNTSMTYQDRVLRSFNSVVPEGGMKPGTSFSMWQSADIINFARDHNFYFRCHNILWDSLKFMPLLNENTTEEELFDFLCRHASRLLYGFGDYIDEVDVVNEPVANRYFQDKYGDQFVADLFQVVNDIIQEINPDILLFVNEAGVDGAEGNWGRAEQIKEFVDGYLDKGAEIDGMGFEAHYTLPVYPQLAYKQMEYVAQRMDHMAITEYDFVSTLANKQQAAALESDLFRDMLITAYSNPKMTGFTMWGFADSAHWRGNAPLYDSMYFPKPKLQYWNDLVWGQWFTQTNGVTDDEGSVSMRGHRGEYDITVEAGGKSAKTTLKVSDKGVNTVNAVVGSQGITLTSSEPVVYKDKGTNYRAQDMYEEDKLANMYKHIYENKVSEVTGARGEDAGFLKEADAFDAGKALDGEHPVYALEAGSSVSASLEAPMESGVVKVSMPDTDGTPYMCEIQGRKGDGEWFVIGRSDSLEQEYLSFDQELDQIRISGVGKNAIQLSGIYVSKKEWVR